jgi:16S rRNA (uracil1498-N3)-methyltransferase
MYWQHTQGTRCTRSLRCLIVSIHHGFRAQRRSSMLFVMTRRRWIADTWTESTATLQGEQAGHLARVLRAQPGQVFDVVANGFLHRAEIISADEREVVFQLHEELEADAALPVHVLMAVFKFDHMEWGIEKATELGVARITPVLARRTDKHLAQAAAKRVERWRRIVREASQQSRRSDVPQMDEPVMLEAALAMVDAQKKLLLAETEQENTLSAALREDVESVALAIGPEGGWTAEEMALFSAGGWMHVTLGPRILRAETAAIAGMAVCAAML